MASVTFYRGNSEEIALRPRSDGQILFDYELDKLFVDFQGSQQSEATRHEVTGSSSVSYTAELPLRIENNEIKMTQASDTASGYITTSDQSLKGIKSFKSAANDTGSVQIGGISLISSNVADNTIISSGNSRPGNSSIGFRDENNNVLGYIYPSFYNNGDQGMTFRSKRTIGETEYQNSFVIGNKKETGDPFVKLSTGAADAWKEALGLSGFEIPLPVSKGGTGATTASNALQNLGAASATHTHSYLPLTGTATGNPVTGDINIKSSNLNFSDVTSETTTFLTGKGIYAQDSSNNVVSGIRAVRNTNNQAGLQVYGKRGNNTNELFLLLGKDGSPVVRVSGGASGTTAAAWRSGLGITPANIGAAVSNHSHSNYLPLSGGQMTGPVTMANATAMPKATGTGMYPVVMGSFNSGGAIKYMDTGDFRTNIGAAATSHTHTMDNLSGTLPISKGGTGLTASPSMLTNLGSTTAANVLTASPRPGITGTLAVGHGGTGATTLTSGSYLVGNGTSAVTLKTPAQVLSNIGAAAASHTHAASAITSGTIDVARLPYTAARGVEISGSTIRTVNGYVSSMNSTKVTKSSGTGTWTIVQTNIEITNTSGIVYVLAFFSISISAIDIKTTKGTTYTSASDQILTFPWTFGNAPRVITGTVNPDYVQDIWIKSISTTGMTFRPLCSESASVTWAGEFALIANKA